VWVFPGAAFLVRVWFRGKGVLFPDFYGDYHYFPRKNRQHRPQLREKGDGFPGGSGDIDQHAPDVGALCGPRVGFA